MRLLLSWILSAVAVWIVAQLGIGISVRGAAAALVAVLVIGFINATIGFVLKILTSPSDAGDAGAVLVCDQRLDA